ncbi:hypothetical protein CW705_06360 [Candidatus Bathyarchaeota archaeon]|nr:MAG: hypothetical protein CW705_06360 [Candidatus Bathyarchaeota archaeon]
MIVFATEVDVHQQLNVYCQRKIFSACSSTSRTVKNIVGFSVVSVKTNIFMVSILYLAFLSNLQAYLLKNEVVKCESSRFWIHIVYL